MAINEVRTWFVHRGRGIVVALAIIVTPQWSAIAAQPKLYLPFTTNAVVCQEMFTNGDFSREPRDADWPEKSGRDWWFYFSDLGGRETNGVYNGGMTIHPADDERATIETRQFPTVAARNLTRATLSFDWKHSSSDSDGSDSIGVAARSDYYRYGCDDCSSWALSRSNSEDMNLIWFHVTASIVPVVTNPLGTSWSVYVVANSDVLFGTSWEFDNWSAQVCARP